MGMDRGEFDLQPSSFLEYYENEQERVRKLGHLEPLGPDDFIIKQSTTYAFSLLHDFFKNKKIAVEDENEVLGQEILALRPIEINEQEDGLGAKYELSYEVEGVKFEELAAVKVKFGNYSADQLTVHVEQESGNRLYFKKIAKSIKNLYSYCKA